MNVNLCNDLTKQINYHLLISEEIEGQSLSNLPGLVIWYMTVLISILKSVWLKVCSLFVIAHRK